MVRCSIFYIIDDIYFNITNLSAYMSCPAHIEIMAEEKPAEVVKEKEAVTLKINKKRSAQLRTVKAGGGI